MVRRTHIQKITSKYIHGWRTHRENNKYFRQVNIFMVGKTTEKEEPLFKQI